MGSGTVTVRHTTIGVCDPRRDGVVVRVHYVLSNSSTTRTREIPDMAGCRRQPVTSLADPVTRIQVCTRGGFSSCTSWFRA